MGIMPSSMPIPFPFPSPYDMTGKDANKHLVVINLPNALDQRKVTHELKPNPYVRKKR
jgi:hypothetical protein